MQNGDGPAVDDAVNDVSELLARAYLRYSRVRLTQSTVVAFRSTEPLDNAGETSVRQLASPFPRDGPKQG